MKPAYFSIPKPCSADWNKMTPTEQGAFCKQCNKEVVDLYPVPSNQIRKTIAAKINPCVRILQSQIDEMNFTEWFHSISLVKQLRYLFLFTLLLVFQQTSHAQEADTTFIPYSNEYLDNLETEMAEAEADRLAESKDSIAASTLTEGIVDWKGINVEIHPPIGDGWMGVPMPPIIGVWDGWDGIFDISVVGGVMLTEYQLEDTLPQPLKNSILLDLNVYAFEVIGNQLHFTYKAIQRQKVRLKITNEAGKIVYFEPIEVGIGENTISYPIDKFKFGHYTITLESETTNGSTKVIYL
jgi:hypothetical protein